MTVRCQLIEAAAFAQATFHRKYIVKSREKTSPAVVEVAKKTAAKKSIVTNTLPEPAEVGKKMVKKAVLVLPAAAKTAKLNAPPASKSKTHTIAAAGSPVKAAAKVQAKSAVMPIAPKSPAPVPAKAATKTTAAAPAPAAAAPASRPAPAPPPMSTLKAPPPLKPGRRSSARTAAQSPPPAPMVPTHAPNAAKASYSAITERVISPPPQAAAKKDPKLANNWKTKPATELMDEEVKSMPDAEYMNEKQLAFFRRKLSILKQEIHNSAGATTEHLREDTAVVPDPADRATIEEEHALELRTRDRERKLLKKIEQSIERIDSGDYGYCDETGEPIGVGRLIARPTANLSLEAQQRHELKQKMFGD